MCVTDIGSPCKYSFPPVHKCGEASQACGLIIHIEVDQLKASGVDVSQYTAHSTRGTATSVAAKAGISTQEIMERARWSNESTFEKCYHRPSQDVHKPSAFGAAVLRTQTGMIYKHAYKDMRKEPKPSDLQSKNG